MPRSRGNCPRGSPGAARVGDAIFYAFVLLELDSKDFWSLRLGKRKAKLARVPAGTVVIFFYVGATKTSD